MTAIFELEIVPAPRGSRELSTSVYEQLRSGILTGRVRPGMRLPSTRNASSRFGISRNTVQDIYERLLHEGLITAVHGSGTFVADRPFATEAECGGRGALPKLIELNGIWTDTQERSSIGRWQAHLRRSALTRAAVDLRPGVIDPGSFPFATFRRMMARQLRLLEIGRWDVGDDFDLRGCAQLRSAIVDHISVTRAVACCPDDVLITFGAQQAFDLAARVLVKRGETVVAMEEPGYPAIRAPFQAAGARIIPVPVDSEGIVVDAIPPSARVICVTPSHQYPLGVPLSEERRRALVEHATRHGAVIIEDDYDGEFRHDGIPLRALRSTASVENVFYVGTFSKCMLPMLRLGFLVAPEWAMDALVAARQTCSGEPPRPVQLAVAAFIRDGHLFRHIRKLRRTYGDRRRMILEALGRGALGRSFEILPSFYGLHVAAFARGNVDCERVCEYLLAHGVMIHSLDRYYLETPRAGMLFGFGAADKRGLAGALHLLGSTFDGLGS